MGQPRDARVTPEIAQQICERTASAATLEGSIASLGSQYVLGLRARNCTTGRILDQQQIQAARQEDVLNALSQIARRFRTRAGESLATVEKHAPLPETTTSSIEALKAYSTGGRATLSGPATARESLFIAAPSNSIPEFAMAHARLGLRYSSLGESELSAESTTKAWLLRDRVERSRKVLHRLYLRPSGHGKSGKGLPNARIVVSDVSPRGTTKSPESVRRHIHSWDRPSTTRRSKHLERRSRLIPRLAMGYGNLAGSYFLTGRFAEAERTIQAASERKLEFDRLFVIRYNIAVLKGDQEQMDRSVALARGKRRVEHWIAHEQSLALARSGRLQAARRSSDRALELALQEGQREAAAIYQAARATWEALCGNAARRDKARDGGAGAFEGPGRRVRRGPGAGSCGRFFSIGGVRRRFGQALSGRYLRQVHLCTSSSRVSRTGARQARKTAWSGCRSRSAMSWQ